MRLLYEFGRAVLPALWGDVVVTKDLNCDFPPNWIRFDFSNISNFVDTKPAYCSIGGYEIVGKNWVRVLVHIVEMELDCANPALDSLYRTPLSSSRSASSKRTPYFMPAKLPRRNCVELSNGYWLNVHYPIPYLVRQIGLFCLHCGYTKEQIILWGVPKSSSNMDAGVESPVKKPSDQFDIKNNNLNDSPVIHGVSWNKPMVAKVIDRYVALQKIDSSKWDQSIEQLTAEMQSYTHNHLPPPDGTECTFLDVAAKIASIHAIFMETGAVGVDYTSLDREMCRIYRNNLRRFRNFVAAFDEQASLTGGEEKRTIVETARKKEKPESVQTASSSAWDIYETAKLVETCIQIQGKDSFMDDIRQLSKAVMQYAEQRGITADDTSRMVYGINKRRPFIDYLLSGGHKGQAGATQTETELVKLYQEQPQRFQIIIDEADRRMGLTPTTAGKQDSPQKQRNACASDGQEKTSTASVSVEENCLQLLRNFHKGIKVGSSLERDKFKNAYAEQYGDELPVDDVLFDRFLKSIGTERDGRIFARSGEEQKCLLEEIRREVTEILDSGVSCVFVESLFERHKEQIESLLQIYQDEDLEPILHQILGDDYVISRQKKQGATICMEGNSPNPDKDVKNCLLHHGTSMTYAEMEKELWFLPFRRVKQAINNISSIICTDDKTYMAVELFPASEDDLGEIRKIIGRKLAESQTGMITDEDCRRMVENELPSLASDLQGLTIRAFQNALTFLLKDDFGFAAHVISRKNQNINSYRVYKDFCEEHKKCSLDDFQEFSKEMNVPIHWETVRERMVRVNEEDFWQKELLHFDVPYVDGLLEQYCQDAYLPLAQIRNFLHFPAMETVWTPYLLESYLYAGFSKYFTLLHARFLPDDCTGAIVRKDAGFDDYDDLMVDVLTHSREWNDRETALDFLVKEGYLKRRRYEKLDEAMKKARLAREKEDD